MADLGALTTGVLAVVALSALCLTILALWVWAIGDLVWMIWLRPGLIGGAIIALAMLITVATYWALPLAHRDQPYLPLFAVVVLTPIAARFLANRLARLQFRKRWGGYVFDVDEDTPAKNLTLFSLAKTQQKALYSPPQAKSVPGRPG